MHKCRVKSVRNLLGLIEVRLLTLKKDITVEQRTEQTSTRMLRDGP